MIWRERENKGQARTNKVPAKGADMSKQHEGTEVDREI